MSQPPISEDNQLSLLLKQFQGVVQAVPGHGTTPAIQYNAETIAKLNSIYSSSVFIDPVPKQLEKNVGQMKNDSSYTDTVWNTSVWDQNLGKTAVNDVNGNPIPYLFFYKGIYLKSTGNDNSWWLPEQSTPATWSSSTNYLRHMIPWLYNDTNASMFTPIIEYWDSTLNRWRTVGLQNQNSGWVIDYASGLVVFYNERSTLRTNYGFDQSAADTDDKARPRISFVRYEGEFLEDAISNGTIGGGGSGVSKVGLSDNSGQVIVGSTFDASAILFNESQFDLSNNAGNAVISVSESAFVEDISRYFFNIPPAPYGGDISKNTTPGIIAALNMNWKLPGTNQTAVPLGKTPHYVDGEADVSDANVSYLPFYKELHIDVIEKSDVTKDPTNQNHWDSFGTAGSTTQPFFPPSLQSALIHAKNTSSLSKTYSFGPELNYPYTNVETDQAVEGGKTYQFRIYLTNDATGSVIDKTYGHTVPWNYYYLPEGSGGQIALGSFGPPTQPTDAQIYNNLLIYNAVSVDIENTNANGADASINNIGWPIPPTLDLDTRFGGDVNGVPDASNISLQMQNVRSLIQDSSAEILGPFGKSGKLSISDIFTTSDLDSSSSNWQWYPETTYTLSDVYMQNDTIDFSDVKASYPGGPTSCNTGIPTRDNLAPLVSTNRLEPNPAEPLEILETIPSIAIKKDAYPQYNAAVVPPILSPDQRIKDIFFITNSDTTDFEIRPNPVNLQQFGPHANNSDRDGGSVGKDSISIDLTKYEMTLQDVNLRDVIPSETTPSMVGFLDVSGIDYTGTNFTLSAESFDNADFPSNGYYTDIIIKKSEMIDICLNNVPDICNNSYIPYEVGIQDICGNDKLNKLTGKFYLARKPLNDINYILPSSLSTPITLNFTFFGQALPILTNSTLPTHTYDITNLDDYWRKSLILATTRSIYNDNLTLENGTNTMAPAIVRWDTFTGNTKTVNPTIVIEPSRIWDISNENDSKRYSRNVPITTNPQFGVYISGENNVARTPEEITGNYPIQFGGGTKHIFWDYTWDQDPNGTTPGFVPNNFFSFGSSSSSPTFSDPWLFLTAQGNLTATTITSQGSLLSHWPNRMPINQLLWANHAFRGPGISNVH